VPLNAEDPAVAGKVDEVVLLAAEKTGSGGNSFYFLYESILTHSPDRSLRCHSLRA
jgi:hypothetical protein